MAFHIYIVHQSALAASIPMRWQAAEDGNGKVYL
jgi:hypothetical protein